MSSQDYTGWQWDRPSEEGNDLPEATSQGGAYRLVQAFVLWTGRRELAHRGPARPGHLPIGADWVRCVMRICLFWPFLPSQDLSHGSCGDVCFHDIPSVPHGLFKLLIQGWLNSSVLHKFICPGGQRKQSSWDSHADLTIPYLCDLGTSSFTLWFLRLFSNKSKSTKEAQRNVDMYHASQGFGTEMGGTAGIQD